MQDADRIDAVETLLEYRFSDRSLLLQALTHRSFLNEAPQGAAHQDNERLEFLGDAVLSLVTSERLLDVYPQTDEGGMSRLRAAYVSEDALFAAGQRSGLGGFVRMGKGQRRGGGANLPSLVADATEAVIAAVYLDGGLTAAQRAVERLLGPLPEHIPEDSIDPKTVLQERVQRATTQSPSYAVRREGGPDHAPRFIAEVRLHHRLLGEGSGDNKKAATRAAAEAALEVLAGVSDADLRAIAERGDNDGG